MASFKARRVDSDDKAKEAAIDFNIHGDNVVECNRIFQYICSGLEVPSEKVTGPISSAICPSYIVKIDGKRLTFRFFPGYGEHRWNQDVLELVKRSGGHLREAADAILTHVHNGVEKPLAAVEFCGALPAGNQAWQRHGRALSFAHAGIPYFFVAELGGFELNADRERTAPRMPNPAAPFSLLAITLYRGSVCLPVYEANAGASPSMTEHYSPIFGEEDFLEFLKLSVLGGETDRVVAKLLRKCIELVKLLAKYRKRRDGLTAEQWQGAYDAIRVGRSLPDFLIDEGILPWNKRTSIKCLTGTARLFMNLGARSCIGLTSSSLPLSIVPKIRRAAFAEDTRKIYPDLSDAFVAWLAGEHRNLAIAWVLGFKPRGDDARPDRGLPPMARMLAGSDSDLLTFIYGPAPIAHWEGFARNPTALSDSNGLWEAIFRVSDGVLVDSATKPDGIKRWYTRETPTAVLAGKPMQLNVHPKVLSLSEQDVDTALHIAFKSLGTNAVFEGMCNPPGGDWSGISFRWAEAEPEFRWLTLPRVSADGGKRPDHVFALFGHGGRVVCLCVESKEHAGSLGQGIGPRLSKYAEVLFDTAPSVRRDEATGRWEVHDSRWQCPDTTFVSAGAYLSRASDPFRGSSRGTGLDIQIGVEFDENSRCCVLHLRGDSELGHSLVALLASYGGWGELVAVQVSN